MPADPEESAAARIWERLEAEHAELGPAIAFQRHALALLRAAVPAAALPESGGAEARTRMLDGIPLLPAAGPRFAGEPPLELLADLARLARRSFAAEGTRETERAARRGAAPARQGLSAALARDPRALVSAAGELGVPAGLFSTLCELAVSPSLRALAEAAAPLLTAVAWRAGYCPVCGAWPILGEIRDADRNRYLRCALCAADWLFPRLGCAFCGESDHRRLSALHVEGEAEHRRAEVCESCKGYVKSLARLQRTPALLLPVEDLATAYLDVLATDAGYARPESPPEFARAAAPAS